MYQTPYLVVTYRRGSLGHGCKRVRAGVGRTVQLAAFGLCAHVSSAGCNPRLRDGRLVVRATNGVTVDRILNDLKGEHMWHTMVLGDKDS